MGVSDMEANFAVLLEQNERLLRQVEHFAQKVDALEREVKILREENALGPDCSYLASRSCSSVAPFGDGGSGVRSELEHKSLATDSASSGVNPRLVRCLRTAPTAELLLERILQPHGHVPPAAASPSAASGPSSSHGKASSLIAPGSLGEAQDCAPFVPNRAA